MYCIIYILYYIYVYIYIYIKLKLIHDKLETDLHMKPTGRYQYLHYLSSNLEHTKHPIAYSYCFLNKVKNLKRLRREYHLL